MRTMIPLLAALAGAAEAQTPSVAPPAMQSVAPGLATYTDGVLFGDVWKRSDLIPRDRSLATVSALIATGKTAQLEGHLGRALDNGVTPLEISGLVTHLAFYAGWPSAVSAIEVIDRVFRARGIDTRAFGKPVDTPPLTVVPAGDTPARGPARNFTGTVTTDTAFKGSGGSRLGGARVTFQPGSRSNWHTHPLGQLLIVTEGRGLVQKTGGAVRTIRAGDTVWTAPGVKHWHGAAPDSAMSHVAVSEAIGGKAVDWLEPVTDAEYRTPPR